MAHLLIRRAAMTVALPAFVAGASAAPALASDSGYDDYYPKVVHVKICKVVKDDKKKDDYYKKDDDHRGKHDQFKMKVETGYYADEAYVKVKDGHCKKIDLKFNKDYKQVYVKEYVPKGYKFVTLKCDGGYGYSKDSYDVCDFKDDWVKIIVINKVVKKHHDYDD